LGFPWRVCVTVTADERIGIIAGGIRSEIEAVLPSSPSNTTEYVFVNDPTTRDHWAVDRKIKPGLYFDWLSERRGNYIFSAVEQFKPKSSSIIAISVIKYAPD